MKRLQNKGWAHSIAHGSDLIVACIKSDFYLKNYNSMVMNLISNNLFKLTKDSLPYLDDEDERQVFIIDSKLEEIFLKTYFKDIEKK